MTSRPTDRLTDAWRQCIGTGRANLSLRAGHQEALEKAQAEIGFRHIRGHGLLSDDMGVLRTAEWQGREVVEYSFTHLDQVIDGYLAHGLAPFLELGFMPEALASGDETVFWWKGNITPPTSYDDWARLVTAVVEHLIDRHGIEQVSRWPIEVWNEPNLTVFWKDADQAEYFKLYEVTARAVKNLDASLQVGGPAISPGASDWWQPFADFVAEREVPIDFLAFHAYTSGPAQHVPFGTYQTLRHPDDLLRQFAEPTELLCGTVLEGLPQHITEFNTSYRPDNPIHDTAYNAAYLAPTLARGGQYVDSFSYWTISDIFEETWIPTSLYHGGFGLLTHGLIPKPTYHLYAFMARMGERILRSGDDHLVTVDDRGRIQVLAWQPVQGTGHVAPDKHRLRLELDAAPGEYYLQRSRTSEIEGNGRAAWLAMGSPAAPDHRQMQFIRECAEARREFGRATASEGRLQLDLTLDQHEVTLLELDPVRDSPYPWNDEARLLGEQE